MVLGTVNSVAEDYNSLFKFRRYIFVCSDIVNPELFLDFLIKEIRRKNTRIGKIGLSISQTDSDLEPFHLSYRYEISGSSILTRLASRLNSDSEFLNKKVTITFTVTKA
jgi:hypothetical protein